MQSSSRASAPAFSTSARGWLSAGVAALVAADVGFIVLELTVGASPTYPDVLHIYEERAVPEYLVYAKWAIAAVVLLSLRDRAVTYRLWALVFCYMLLDDSLMLHERVAGKLSQWFAMDAWLQLPWPAWIVLEVVYMLGIAVIGLLAVWWFLRREINPLAARYSREALVLVGVFVAFAGVGDFLGHVIGGGTRAAEIVEEGGEMFVSTTIVLHALRQMRREQTGTPSSRRSATL